MKTFVALLCLAGIASASVLPARKQLQPSQALIPHVRANEGYGRIIGGTLASEGQFPFMVNLLLHKDLGNYICGGTIYQSNRVLTAAHCCDGLNSVDIFAGSTERADQNGQVLATSNFVQHEDYDANTISNDVCVLMTDEDFDLSDPNVDTVSLASTSMPEEPQAGTRVRAIGWGKTSDNAPGASDDLYYVEDLDVISDAESQNAYGNLGWADKFCIDTDAGQHGVCSGDSGGPVIDQATNEQVGVNSFVSSAGCESAFFSTHCFADVGYFSDWIAGVN